MGVVSSRVEDGLSKEKNKDGKKEKEIKRKSQVPQDRLFWKMPLCNLDWDQCAFRSVHSMSPRRRRRLRLCTRLTEADAFRATSRLSSRSARLVSLIYCRGIPSESDKRIDGPTKEPSASLPRAPTFDMCVFKSVSAIIRDTPRQTGGGRLSRDVDWIKNNWQDPAQPVRLSRLCAIHGTQLSRPLLKTSSSSTYFLMKKIISPSKSRVVILDVNKF